MAKKSFAPGNSKKGEGNTAVIPRPAEPRNEKAPRPEDRTEPKARTGIIERRPEHRPEHRVDKNFVENYELPSSYNSTNITLLPRDPHWIHAFWEIAPSSIESFKARLGQEFDNARCVIRMHDVTHKEFDGANANRTFDVDVGYQTNNYYFNLWCDNVSYCADLGLRLNDGSFHQFARSNFVSTPRSGPSDRSEQMWMEVKDSERSGRHNAFVLGEIRRRATLEKKEALLRRDMPPEAARRTRRIILNEDDIRSYYSKLSPLLRDIIARRIAKQQAAASAGEKRASASVLIDGRRILLKDLVKSGRYHTQFMKRLLGGASEELVTPGGSESIVPGSIGASEQKLDIRNRKFFFEIGTELIVYGRTEPDATVWLGDKNIPLRNDGTFTLRFALPDGKIPLDFAAQSKDKVDRREISTSVERAKTRYA